MPTQVPNSSLVENVYINENLTAKEVYNILSNLEYVSYSGMLIYIVVSNSDMSSGISIMKNVTAEGDGYNVLYSNGGENTPYWTVAKVYSDNSITGAYKPSGFEELVNPITFNFENQAKALGDQLGMVNQNDKLTNLISITPFEEPIALKPFLKGIADAIREKKKTTELINAQNFRSEILSIQGGVNVVKGGGTVVPNDTSYVEKVYFNTDLSVEEVVALLSSVEFYTTTDGMLIYFLFNVYNSKVAYPAVKQGNDYIIVDNTFNPIFSSMDVPEMNATKGWQLANFTNPIDINGNLIDSILFNTNNPDVPVGYDNDKLTSLISTTPFGNQVIKTLEGDYKAVDIVVDELPSGSTPLENNLNVEKIYFNTKLTTEEVDAILDTLTLDSNLSYTINYQQVNETTTSYTPLIITKAEAYVSGASGYAILRSTLELIYASNETVSNFVSSYLGISASVGWNVSELEATNGTIIDVGVDGDKLTQLFSATPFVEPNTIDLEQYLDNKQMPLSVKVNIGSTNIVSQDGVVVPNTGYVEKIYFNTSLSIDEVVSLLSQLTYNSNDMYCLLSTTDGTLGNTILVVTMGVMYAIADIDTQQYFFCNVAEAGFGFVGWNPDFNGVYDINKNAQTESGSEIVGAENDKLTSLVSIDSFENKVIKKLSGDYEAVNIEVTENKTVDVETYLDNKQIPINVKVNVGQFVEVTGDSGTLTSAQMSLLASNETYVLKDGVKYYYTHSETIDSTEIKHYRAILKYDTTTSPDTITLGEFGYIPSIGLWQSGESKVNVEPNLQEKEITENGEYVADEGYDGFIKVTVNVASSGEDMLQARVDATNSCEYLFYQYKGENVDFIKDLDTSNVTSMKEMFYKCSALETIPLLDTSNVTNMSGMFYKCSALETIPQLDTKNNTAFADMFYDCIALQTIPQLNVIKMTQGNARFFTNCQSLTNLTLLNIKVNLQIGSGTSWGHLLTLDSLINTVKECINVGIARTLTIGTANLEKIASTYVKFTDTSQTTILTNEKGDVVVCESTDTGAMLLKDYALLKNWTLA